MANSAPQPDEVTLGDPTSPVGLCTLWTRQERILRAVPPALYAVCGNLYSLWGISLLVRGVLTRPELRYLVVCGVDFADTGRALVALVAHGLAADGTLPGTAARLAEDLDAAAVARFCAQVTAVDLRGCADGARVAAAIRALPPPPPASATAHSPILVPAGWTPPPLAAPDAVPANPSPASRPSDAPPGPASPNSAATPDPFTPIGERTTAALPSISAALTAGQATADRRGGPPRIGGLGGQRFIPDPCGNFLIAVDGEQLVAAHATATGGPTGQRFVGRTAAEVCRAILAAGLVSQLDHAAYLGAELARAELAVRLRVPYRQDRPLSLPRR